MLASKGIVLKSRDLTIRFKTKLFPQPAPPVKKYYTVKAGDTFGKIAQRNNLTQAQLQRLNPGVRVNSIDIGQRIRIK